MDQARFELYAFWRTSATYRVRVALALKGLPCEERFVDNDAGENRSEAFLRINPLGGLPVMRDRASAQPGAALTQSLAILEYLEEVAPAPALLPADPLGRARVRSLALILAADTHPFITPRVRRYLTETAGFDADRFKAWQRHWLETGLRAFETRLAAEPETGRFCHGDTVTLADICLASVVAVVRVFGIRIEGVPTIDKIVGECEGLEAFAAADPMRQEGAPAAA